MYFLFVVSISLMSFPSLASPLLHRTVIETFAVFPSVGILAKARGLAILTVFKAGFLVTARGGSGIVIAKLRDELDYSEGV